MLITNHCNNILSFCFYYKYLSTGVSRLSGLVGQTAEKAEKQKSHLIRVTDCAIRVSQSLRLAEHQASLIGHRPPLDTPLPLVLSDGI